MLRGRNWKYYDFQETEDNKYLIAVYNSDGSFEDYEDLVELSDNENVVSYIQKIYC